jgi:ATP phosphoribosyltransferase
VRLLSVGVARGKGSLESLELVLPGSSRRLQAHHATFDIDALPPIRVTFARGRDLPWLLRDRYIDVAIASSIVFDEYGDGSERAYQSLPAGACTLSLITGAAVTAADIVERVATRYPRTTSQALRAVGYADVELVLMAGSVEAAITLDVTSAIVDIVATGRTLQANKLKVVRSLRAISHAVYCRADEDPPLPIGH